MFCYIIYSLARMMGFLKFIYCNLLGISPFKHNDCSIKNTFQLFIIMNVKVNHMAQIQLQILVHVSQKVHSDC